MHVCVSQSFCMGLTAGRRGLEFQQSHESVGFFGDPLIMTMCTCDNFFLQMTAHCQHCRLDLWLEIDKIGKQDVTSKCFSSSAKTDLVFFHCLIFFCHHVFLVSFFLLCTSFLSAEPSTLELETNRKSSGAESQICWLLR